MNQPSHGGVRPGAGRKPTSERRVKRAVSLTVAADAVVLAQRQLGESYSAALERVLLAQTMPAPAAPVARTPLEQLLAVLCPERQRVAQLYRRLGWSRQAFERLIQHERSPLAACSVRLHVATKDAASGRREQYITVDGVRYSALSRDR